MSQNYYKLYIDSVFDLASTIVIKSELSAEYINNLLKLRYGEASVDPNDKTTWKYYLNICGFNHPTDTPITITSLDNGTQIIFDSDNLEDHPFTKESYQYGTRFYRELITAYPDRELLIIGSLYPANMEKAIEASDGSVLSYPVQLIEENELSLISNIEKWIHKFKVRWDNKQFNLSDSLYGAANHAVMYLNLIPLILNLRLQACKTNEVHSFHVRQYLASHGMLDVYLNHLSLKQALFLYRNINYIERNNGKKEIFDWLIDRILTESGIPIAEYSMRHNVTNLQNDLLPKLAFRKKDLNNVYSGLNTEFLRLDLDTILNKEEPVAVSNDEFIYFEKDKIQKRLQYSLSSVVGTKMLESSMVDYSSSDSYPLVDIQLNHWLFYSLNRIYTANIVFTEPRTGTELTLSALDAYIYWFYIYCKSVGVNFPRKTIVDQAPLPNLSFSRAVTMQRLTRDDFSLIAQLEVIDPAFISEVLGTHIGVVTISSVNRFREVCESISSNATYQSSLVAMQEHFYKRGVLQKCVNRLYIDGTYSLRNILISTGSNAEDYQSWLYEKNIVEYDYSPEECELIYSDLFSKATGGTLYTTKAKSDLQVSMLKLMSQLSSYSIQFLSEINKSNIKNLNWASIRLGDIFSSESSKLDVVTTPVRPKVLEVTEETTVLADVSSSNIRATTSTITSDLQTISIKIKPLIGSDLGTLHTHQMRIGTISINPCFFNDPNFVGGIKTFESYETFNTLTQSEQLSVRDVYFDTFANDPTAGKIKLSGVILRDIIGDFNYTKIKNKILKAFTYKYIPKSIGSGVRSMLTVELDALYSNLGTQELPGFKLMNKEAIASLFNYFGKTTILNSFLNSGGELLLDINAMHEMLGFGTSLNIFTGLTPVISLDGFSYAQESTDVNFTLTADKYSLNFVRPFFGSSVALHPTEPGQIVNAFKLVSSSSVIGGFSYAGYNLTGFSYNGTQVEFN